MVGQYTSYDWLPLVPFSMVWKTPDLKNDQENKPILIATRLWTWVLNCFYHLLPTWILISLLFEDMHSHDSSHSTQTSNDFLLRYYNNLSDLARLNWCKKNNAYANSLFQYSYILRSEWICFQHKCFSVKWIQYKMKLSSFHNCFYSSLSVWIIFSLLFKDMLSHIILLTQSKKALI